MKFVFARPQGLTNRLTALSGLRVVALAVVFSATTLLGGCGASTEGSSEGFSAPELIQDLSAAEVTALSRARLALAQKLGLPDVEAATLITISAQQWNNSSLGCAIAGEMSAQVMLDGHKVVLAREGLRYQVHVGPSSVRVCADLAGSLAVPNRSSDLASIPGLQQRAVADLAERLGLPESAIVAERVGVSLWPDGSLGCPEPGVVYPQVEVSGYQLPLRVNGTLVVYNTDGRRVVNCTDPFAQEKPPVDR